MGKFNLKFAANLSTMFSEFDFVDRYKAAKECGFKAVEMQFPYYNSNLEALKEAKENSGLIQTLINSYPGDLEKGSFGFAALPSHESEFKESLDTSIRFAKALNCTKIHIIAGMDSIEHDNSIKEETYIKNLKYASSLLENHSIIGVIEPLCPEVKLGYFLSSYEKAIEYVKAVGSSNIKVLLDLYHFQMLGGDISTGIKPLYPYAGHVQISQAPGRQEPNYSGLINYKSVFEILQSLGHEDYIGLEYFPSDTTLKSLDWFKELECEI